ncbi:DsbA family protein [archaeon]|jgi:protein-disulfide isomerase|nr:DsbA family protein [archaeon]
MTENTVTIKKDSIWKIATGILVIALIVIIATGGFGSKGTTVTGNTIVGEKQVPEVKRVQIDTEGDAILGDVNAPVTLIEFSDYECPFCGRHFGSTYGQIKEKYVDTGKVKIIFKDFPLSFHQNAQKASEAAECAGDQGKYYEYHDILFNNQQALGIDSLKQYAKDLGLNTETFNSCLDSGEKASEVQEDFQEGQRVGVRGTPANFINGNIISGACPIESFDTAINAELEGKAWRQVPGSCSVELL